MSPHTTPPMPTISSAEPEPQEGEALESSFLRNSLLVVLERKWYALAVFLLVVLGTGIYTYFVTPIYNGAVTVQVLKHGPQLLRGVDIVENSITSDVDFNTQIKVLDSLAIVQNVATRLTPEEVKLLTAPFQKSSGSAASPVSIIYGGRRIIPQRATLITSIQFRHPDPKMAARIANLIASEYIAYNSRLRVDESLKAVDDLKDRADQQRKRVDDLANALQTFRQRGNLISLMQSKDIVTEKLKALNMMATQATSQLMEAEVRWNQVKAWTETQRNLAELQFIAAQPKVTELLLQIAGQKQAISQMTDRYKDKHPRMIEARTGLAQSERELQGALESAANSIKAQYENARQNEEGARKALANQEEKSLDLDKSSVEYENLNREFRVNEQLLESMMVRMREASVSSSIEIDSARIVDRAFEPGSPISPNVGANMAIGVVGGLFLGFAFAFLLATIDNRIKTPFDVERLVGLPLIGSIPRVEKMEQPDKAQIVTTGTDRLVAESFLSIYSSLRVNEASRNARLLLVTSTVPGEGKSFVAANLAQTYAAQGLRTAIVDCDLRKPTIQQSFRLGTSKGVIDYCYHGAKLDEIVTPNVHPNLDVVAVGGRAKNPIQLLNSLEFEQLVTELGKRYDRVVFDSPPLGAVSDALNILVLMDGAIYVIRHNKVERGLAQNCVKRLLAANVAIFGAVLNDQSTGSSGDYYLENNKLFREYYDVAPPAPDLRASG